MLGVHPARAIRKTSDESDESDEKTAPAGSPEPRFGVVQIGGKPIGGGTLACLSRGPTV